MTAEYAEPDSREVERINISRKTSDRILGATRQGDCMVVPADQIDIIHNATDGFTPEQINRILGLLSLCEVHVDQTDQDSTLVPFSEAEQTAAKPDEQIQRESDNRRDLGDIFRMTSVNYAALYADIVTEAIKNNPAKNRGRSVKLPALRDKLEMDHLDAVASTVVHYWPGEASDYSINKIETTVKGRDIRGFRMAPRLETNFSHGEITTIVFENVNPRGELFEQAFEANQFGAFMNEVTSQYREFYSIRVDLVADRPAITVSSPHGVVCEYRYDAGNNDFKRLGTQTILDDPDRRKRPDILSDQRFSAVVHDMLRVIPTIRTR